MITLECEFGDGPHKFPDDWKFGGYQNTSPAFDWRFFARNYAYYDSYHNKLFVTSSPLCDGEAISWAAKVAQISMQQPAYIVVRGNPLRRGGFSESPLWILSVPTDVPEQV